MHQKIKPKHTPPTACVNTSSGLNASVETSRKNMISAIRPRRIALSVG